MQNKKAGNINFFSMHILLVIIMLFAVGCGGNGAGTGGGANAPTDHLSLGERFLLELEYEQALFHFLALIEIEPMNPRGYTGAAQAHVGLGQLNEAIAILQLGLEVLPDNADILDILEEIEISLLGQSEIFSEQCMILLTEIARLVAYGNYEGAMEKSANVESWRVGPDPFSRYIVNTIHGQIGIYATENYGQMFFHGEFSEKNREGFGVWFNPHILSKGEWANDMPNGHFFCIMVRPSTKSFL